MNSTTCIHCKASFDGGVEIIGRPSKRLEDLVRKLGQHMAEKHSDILQAMNVDGAAYVGWLFLNNFKSMDEKLNLERDKARWAIHQRTLNARFSDESLQRQCGHLAIRLIKAQEIMALNNNNIVLDADLQKTFESILLEVFTGMRDDLEEPNRYSEAKPEQLVS